MTTLSEEEKAVRDTNHFDVLCLRPYLLILKEKELGFLHCEACGEIDGRFDFHHKRYGLYVTVADLLLVCEEWDRELNPR